MTTQTENALLLDALAPRLKDRRLAASPILRGVPPSEYMLTFMDNSHEFLPIEGSMERYYALASVDSFLLGRPFTHEHMRVLNVLHAEKKLRHNEFINLPQDELISVIMPTKNRADALEGAILSMMVQSYKNWELIIINDGGDDEPEKVISAFNDPRIRYFKLEKSTGPSQARNIAITKTDGAYIAYLDDDDQWDPDFLLISYGELVKHKRRFVYSAQMVWYNFNPESNLGDGVITIRYVPFNRSYIENINFISMISCMHEKSLLDEAGVFDINLRSGVDWDLFLRLLEVTDPMETPCILSHYYMFRYQQNVTNTQTPLLMGHRIAVKQQKRSPWKQKLKREDGKNFDVYSLPANLLKYRQKKCDPGAPGQIKTIIFHKGNPEKLWRCIDSLNEHTPLLHEICVVDHHAGPAERRLLQENADTVAANIRLASTTRLALEQCFDKVESTEQDFIVFTNSNTLFTSRWLEELLNLFSCFPDAGMAVPRCTLPPHSPVVGTITPHLLASFEADIALVKPNIIRPNIDFEGFFELRQLQGFTAFLIQARLARELSGALAKLPETEAIQNLCETLGSETNKKIYYTPFSKLYFIPGVTAKA